MAPVTKKTLKISVIVGLALVAAFAGGTVGFLQGYVYGLGDTGARAYTLTTALRTLRTGDVTKGVSQLESDLDTLIMEHWASNRGEPPLLSWLYRAMGDDTSERKLFARVARYRAEYPSPAPTPEVKETIASHLKGFQAQ
jgi:hypothetical protein